MLTRKPRSIHGQTNRAPRHLCQLPNPAETVASIYMSNIADQRHLHDEMRDSLVRSVEFTLARDRTVHPPPLFTAHAVLDALPSPGARKPEAKLLSGLAGILAAPDNTEGCNDHESRKTIRVAVPPHRFGAPVNSGGDGIHPLSVSASPKRDRGSTRGASTDGGSGGVSPRTARNATQAALSFIGGGKAVPQGVTPSLPPMPVIHTRMERRGDHAKLTFSLTQPDSHSALYVPPSEQFASSGRGLDIGLMTHHEKMRKLAAKETKTAIRREKEAAVVASRLAEGERGVRIEEGRIRSKALQAEQYKERLSQYKFTQ